MEPFHIHSGIVAAMDRANVDTDQIIPKEFLKRIERTGFGQYLFFDWRFRPDGTERPEFELNRSEAAGATILLARRNFGCGSSREHAPWALKDYGFRVLIAPSFADIFYNNCFKNGILPIRVSDEDADKLFQRAKRHVPYRLTADLETCLLTDEHGFMLSFDVDRFRRQCLLEGLDDIALTLEHEERIACYEAVHRPRAGATPG
jgi:3-isopropylmalate/(R)-2-methylmalate dehydratase small subunit